jgi:hypothetical protein
MWGILSNGRQLRILRDNASVMRQAFVEFDLTAMMDGQVYPDFVLLWLLIHESRFEADSPSDCWLEKWAREAEAQGTRALDDLRDAVSSAITALGQGFLSHPANGHLRGDLQSGELDKQDYYRQLLRLVYRLLFLFVAEDRDLLLSPDASAEARERYRSFYSVSRFRSLAERRRGTQHADLYESLKVVMEILDDAGSPDLGVPALGSFLWRPTTIGHLGSSQIANRDFLTAISALAFTIQDRSRRPIDYRNLGSEELGSVYESLLELHPELHWGAGTFQLRTAAGHERKSTGSYYTPTNVIARMLDSVLDPVLEEAARKPDPAKAILDLKIVDPACGSGHFLIAAAHRIAKRLATVYTGDDEPSPNATRAALRDVISHCIYAVDLNEMAVELCKVGLWMEALEPGKALSFLDHHVLHGNSLLGATPEMLAGGIPDVAYKPIADDDKAYASSLRKRNSLERRGEFEFEFELPTSYMKPVVEMAAIEAMSDESVGAVRDKEQRYEALLRSPETGRATLAADSWCAAFMSKKTEDLPGITQRAVARAADGSEGLDVAVIRLINGLKQESVFHHWHLAFPRIFGRDLPTNAAGWRGGFDVVVGNPPYVDSETLTKTAPRLRHFIDSTYDSAEGNWDLFVAFLELATRITREGGALALLTPNRLLAADYSAAIQRAILSLSPMTCLDFSGVRVFEDAAIAVISLAVRNRPGDPAGLVTFISFDRDFKIVREAKAKLSDLRLLPPGYIGLPLAEADMAVLEMVTSAPRISEVAAVSDGATTGEAYELRAVVQDGSASHGLPDFIRLTNTGGIDPYNNLWGIREITYLKFKGLFPVIAFKDLKRIAPRRLDQALLPKVMVAGMASRLEAVADEGGYLCGKSAVLLLPVKDVCPFALALLLNSALINRVYRGLFSMRGFGGQSMNIGPRQVEQLPIPANRAALLPYSGTSQLTEAIEYAESLATSDLIAAIQGECLLSRIGKALHASSPVALDGRQQRVADRVVEAAMGYMPSLTVQPAAEAGVAT